MSAKLIWRRGMAILCSSALVFSLAISASAAELSPEDAPGKIVVGMVVEVTDEEVTLEVRDTGRDGMAEAPEAPEGEPAVGESVPEKPDGEQADMKSGNGNLSNNGPVNAEMPHENPNGEPVEGEPSEEMPALERAEGEVPPAQMEGELEEGEVPPEQMKGELEEGAVPPEKPELEEKDSTFVLNVEDLNDLEPEVGDMLCIVLDADGAVISAELLQMDVMPINDEKVTE